MAVIIRTLLIGPPSTLLLLLAYTLIEVATANQYTGRPLVVAALFSLACIMGTCAMLAWAWRRR